MTSLESMIDKLRADYKVNGEKENDGPIDASLQSPKILGKRQKSISPEPSSLNESKRVKVDEKLSVTKSDQTKNSTKKS